eukprot:s4175_g5.t1
MASGANNVPTIKAQYAQSCEKKGFYLGILDLCLFSIAYGKELAVVYWDDENSGNPVIRSGVRIMEQFVPDHVIWEGPHEPDLASPDVWIFAAVRADWQRGSFRQLNHFIPVFSKQQLEKCEEGLFESTTKAAIAKLDQNLRKTHQRIEDESDDDLAESLKDRLALLNSKADFFQTMHGMDLHALEVPADGDCAIWSVLTLFGGPVIGRSLKNNAHVLQLRKES